MPYARRHKREDRAHRPVGPSGLVAGVAEDCQSGPPFITNQSASRKGSARFQKGKAALFSATSRIRPSARNSTKILKSEQIARYKSLSRNIVLTDYLKFIWINKDGIRRETLCYETDLENPRFRLREDRVAAVSKLLSGFFSTAPEGIGRAQQLALALASRSKLLRDYLGEELIRQEPNTRGAALRPLPYFPRSGIPRADVKEFADAFAQMLAYGLFLARLKFRLGGGDAAKRTAVRRRARSG